ncbi:mRNA surveillance protein pelota [Candidatus Woesearchaeota archaeon]|nr:mRNA surveillance protein pelota [Candidatus Woesearchaeota archaeon]
MQLIHQDLKKGKVKIKLTDPEDVWYLTSIIDPGDTITGTASRKIKIGADEHAKVTKKIFTVTLEAVEISPGSDEKSLRINGKVLHAPDFVPLGSYQAIELTMGDECVLEKTQWMSYQQQKLKEACEQRHAYLLCIFDREEAIFALTKTSGFEVLVKLQGDVTNKRTLTEVKKDFHQELISLIETYTQRYIPEKIILASPAFYKEILFQKINNVDLKKQIVLASCSDVSEAAFGEVMKRQELQTVLRESRIREEELLIDELLREINKEHLAVYGWKETQEAVFAGAVGKLLVTDNFVKKKRTEGAYAELDLILKSVDKLDGKIFLLSSNNNAGKKLDGIGGIAALLRYKIRG